MSYRITEAERKYISVIEDLVFETVVDQHDQRQLLLKYYDGDKLDLSIKFPKFRLVYDDKTNTLRIIDDNNPTMIIEGTAQWGWRYRFRGIYDGDSDYLEKLELWRENDEKIINTVSVNKLTNTTIKDLTVDEMTRMIGAVLMEHTLDVRGDTNIGADLMVANTTFTDNLEVEDTAKIKTLDLYSELLGHYIETIDVATNKQHGLVKGTVISDWHDTFGTISYGDKELGVGIVNNIYMHEEEDFVPDINQQGIHFILEQDHYGKLAERIYKVVTFVFKTEKGIGPSYKEVIVRAEKGKVLGKPFDPRYVGHNFIGWFTDSDWTELYDFDSFVEDDMVLYAGWEVATVLVRFDLNGGYGTLPEGHQVLPGTKIQLPHIDDINKPSHRFLGWCTNHGGLGHIYQPGSEYEVEDSIILYVAWIEELQIRFFSFRENGNGAYGEPLASITVDYGNLVTFPDDPALGGWQFEGWYDEPQDPFSNDNPPEEKGNRFFGTDPIIRSADYYAYFTDQVFEVRFFINDMSPNAWKFEASFDKGHTVVWFPNEHVSEDLGIRFTEWFSDSECTEPFGDTPVTKNTNLYTKLTYRITFNNNGSDQPNSASQWVKFGETAEEVNEPVWEGNDFNYWMYQDTSDQWNQWYWNTVVKKPYNLFANWDIVSYEVIFKHNNGIDSDITLKFNHGEKIYPIPVSARPGYKFDGWIRNNNGLLSEWDFETPVTSDLLFEAKWEQIMIDVIFKFDNDDPDKELLIPWGSKIPRPESDPTKYGYDFVDWYYANELGEPSPDVWPFETTLNDDHVSNSGIILIAVWEKIFIDVTFIVNNTDWLKTSISVDTNSKVIRPDDPTSSLNVWEFDGWLDEDGESFDFNTMFDINDLFNREKDIKIIADITELWDVTFVTGDGGTSIPAQKIRNNEFATRPSDPEKEGWEFIKWDREFDLPITNHTTFTAEWEEIIDETGRFWWGNFISKSALQSTDIGFNDVFDIDELIENIDNARKRYSLSTGQPVAHNNAIVNEDGTWDIYNGSNIFQTNDTEKTLGVLRWEENKFTEVTEKEDKRIRYPDVLGYPYFISPKKFGEVRIFNAIDADATSTFTINEALIGNEEYYIIHSLTNAQTASAVVDFTMKYL